MNPLFRIAAVSIVLTLAGCGTTPQQPVQHAQPIATPAPVITSAVTRINYYRRLVHWTGISRAPSLDAGAAMHARYVLENHLQPTFIDDNGQLKQIEPQPGFLRALVNASSGMSDTDGIQSGLYEEDPKNPWYTREGAEAAKSCLVFQSSKVPDDGGAIIDQLMSEPVSAIAILDPTASAVGYGQYCDGAKCIVVTPFWVGSMLTSSELVEDPNQKVKLADIDVQRMWLKTPREYPPSGSPLPTKPLGNLGYFDPLTSCPGYTRPAGGPILLSLGWGRDADVAVRLSSYSLSESGKRLESCAFDATSYQNPDIDQQTIVRRELINTLGAVMIPRNPLEAGHTYDVSMTVNDKTYEWSFTTASK